MRATILNCTLKKSPEPSNTQDLADVVGAGLRELGTDVRSVRLVDHAVLPGVSSDLGEGDDWPGIRREVLESDILIMASPTWLGRPSSVAQRALERMDAMMSETGEDGMPVAYNRVAGVVVTGNEDGAHHVISEINGGLVDIGFTVPGQSWVYWNMGPGPGPDYTATEHGHRYAHQVAGMMARNLYGVATALRKSPIPQEFSREAG
ncbi:flavodoxin family protein [Amycolatopsis sp. K13G38]|uniref:Flavodoxin family protein n=1 Tax=Amycolatopsis acididurans TaxID=2724524 RepID=A0ABX1JG30_9PSEU|nr:flavodoxin family protein [Amycolatopsis acididurans]NKQ58568.1 flavodoxin family protein [Amycolatopsis acididurans]